MGAHRTARARASGFTLVELLVSLAVVAAIAVLSWQGVDGMLRARERLDAHDRHTQALAAALAQWGADLDALIETGAVSAVEFDGRSLRLTRRDAVDEAIGVRVVAWATQATAQGPRWMRWQSPPLRSRGEVAQAWGEAAQWAANPSQALRAREVDLLAVLGWRVFYFRGDSWTNPQSSADGEREGSRGGSPIVPPPEGVRLVVDLAPEAGLQGRLVRDWARPQLSGRRP